MKRGGGDGELWWGEVVASDGGDDGGGDGEGVIMKG